MQDMRHLNLFSRITKIDTRYCMKYNEMLIFCVPRNFLMKAIGEDARNIREMSEILGRRVRIIPSPRGIQDARQFIENIVRPVTFKDLEIKNSEIILTAGSQSKAALIGRNRRRLLEMQKIVKDYFGKEFRII
jgi:transcription antitermination factor NusA-like protein